MFHLIILSHIIEINLEKTVYQNISSLMPHLFGALIILILHVFGNYLIIEKLLWYDWKFSHQHSLQKEEIKFSKDNENFPFTFLFFLSLPLSHLLLLSQSVSCLFLFSESLKPINSHASCSRETVAHIWQWTGLVNICLCGHCMSCQEWDIPFWGIRVGNA